MKEKMPIWKQVLFWLYTIFIGFRMYKTQMTGAEQPYDSSSAIMSYGDPLQFMFYKTPTEFHQYRFGTLKKIKGIRYGIMAHFDENDPRSKELAEQYNGYLLSFYIPYSQYLPDRSISRYILHVYLEYIFDQLPIKLEDEEIQH